MMRRLLFILAIASTAYAGMDPNKVTTNDLSVGQGKAAADGDDLVVNVSATSLDDGKPIKVQSPYKWTLGRGQAIRGFDDGVRGMRKDGRRMITVPSAFAYNDGRNFVFTVELTGLTPGK